MYNEFYNTSTTKYGVTEFEPVMSVAKTRTVNTSETRVVCTLSLVVGRCGEPTDIIMDSRATTECCRDDTAVPSFRRRPLTWSASSDNDQEQPAASPCSGEEHDLFRALLEEDDADGRHDDDDADSSPPEMTSSTWISLFRTFFMGVGGGQPRAPSSDWTAARRRLEDRDVEDLLDRTLSTITEEEPGGVDELARTLSELDEDLADSWRRERGSSSCEDQAGCSDDDDDVAVGGCSAEKHYSRSYIRCTQTYVFEPDLQFSVRILSHQTEMAYRHWHFSPSSCFSPFSSVLRFHLRG